MRVIAGTRKGTTLKTPNDGDIRPTRDRVKESLFNILGGFFPESWSVLDLFAGTGSLGIEALSRGAGSAVFVDRSPKAVEIIRDNLTRTDFQGSGTVKCRDVLDFLRSGKDERSRFDLVFIDAPYQAEDTVAAVLEMLGSGSLLQKEAIVVVESSQKTVLSSPKGDLHGYDRREYGSTALTFWRRR